MVHSVRIYRDFFFFEKLVMRKSFEESYTAPNLNFGRRSLYSSEFPGADDIIK